MRRGWELNQEHMITNYDHGRRKDGALTLSATMPIKFVNYIGDKQGRI